MTRRAKKAAKRARQRSVVEEELEEFYMPQEEPETSEHLEAVMSAMECTYRGHRQGMKPYKFQSTDGHIFNVERDFAKQQVTFMFGEEEPVTNEMARRDKKAAKRARQRSAKYGTAAVVKVEDWRLECTYNGCTAGEGGAKFKTPSPCTSKITCSPGTSQGSCPCQAWSCCRGRCREGPPS